MSQVYQISVNDLFEYESGLDKFLKYVLGPAVAIMTFWFSLDFFVGLWSDGTGLSTVKCWLAAGIITGMEVYMWRIAVLHKNGFALAVAVLISLVSVMGSLGAFETGFMRNIFQSDAYQAKKQSYVSKQKTADGWIEASKDKKMTGWALKQGEKAQTAADNAARELDNLSETGATGEGSGLYASMADLFGTNLITAARATNRYIAVAFEICLIFLTCYSAQRDRDRNLVNDHRKQMILRAQSPQSDGGITITPQEAAVIKSSGKDDVKSNGEKKSFWEKFSPFAMFGKGGAKQETAQAPLSPYDKLNDQEKQQYHLLKRYLKATENNEIQPSLSEMASACGASSGGTVRRYLEMMNYMPREAHQGAKFSTDSADETDFVSKPSTPKEFKAGYLRDGIPVETKTEVKVVQVGGNRPDVDTLNGFKDQAEKDRYLTVKNILENHSDLSQSKQIEMAGMSKNTFKKYKKMAQG